MKGIGYIAMFAFTIAQLIAGYQGIEHKLGMEWAISVFLLAIVFRSALPVTIGAFFGAMSVWGWPWYLALVFVAPGLLFVVPGAIVSALRPQKTR